MAQSKKCFRNEDELKNKEEFSPHRLQNFHIPHNLPRVAHEVMHVSSSNNNETSTQNSTEIYTHPESPDIYSSGDLLYYPASYFKSFILLISDHFTTQGKYIV